MQHYPPPTNQANVLRVTMRARRFIAGQLSWRRANADAARIRRERRAFLRTVRSRARSAFVRDPLCRPGTPLGPIGPAYVAGYVCGYLTSRRAVLAEIRGDDEPSQ